MRKLVLTQAGYDVISLCGHSDLNRLANYVNSLDLLVLAHEVPVEEKRRALILFKEGNDAPTLSLLGFNQLHLPEADFSLQGFSAADLMRAVKKVLE